MVGTAKGDFGEGRKKRMPVRSLMATVAQIFGSDFSYWFDQCRVIADGQV